MKKKNLVFPIVTTLLLIALFVLLIIFFNKLSIFKNNNGEVISPDTHINGINISNLSRADAYEAVSTYIKNKSQGFSLTLKHNDQIYILDEDDYTINNDINTIIDVAKGDDEYDSTLKTLNYFTTHGNTTTIAFNYIFQGIDSKINDICNLIETKPIDSSIHFDPTTNPMFTITESISGTKVNRDKLYNSINEQFQKTNKVLIELELENAEPNITKEDNEKLTNLVSTFTTNVSDSTGGRKNNVKLALSKFNGLVVQPNETISFNKITSPHTLNNGYEIATIIYKGRFVDGVGGGICQASTTLYNALVTAGLKIDEVHKHTLPVRYVPLALDAMVSEGSADLVFTNTTDSPIFIKTYSTSDNVTVDIYSKPNPDGFVYKTRSETIETLPALPDKVVADVEKEHTDKVIFKGEKHRLTYGREGYDVISYLQIWQNDRMIKEEKLRHEVYMPQPGIIIEGIEDPIESMPIIENNEIIESISNNNNDFLLNPLPSNICP